MKVVGLIISQLNKGGAERVVSRLSKLLSNKYRIFVILYDKTGLSYDVYGQVIYLSDYHKKKSLIPIFIRRICALKRVKQLFKLDAAVSFLDTPNFINILSKNKKCSTHISVRNYTPQEISGKFNRFISKILIKTLYNKSNTVICVSKVIADVYEMKYGIHRDRIKVVYNPYDINEIIELSNENIENNQIFQKDIIISVGRVMKQKGYWHLIKAFSILTERHKNSHLIIIGKEYDGGKAKKLANELGLSNLVTFLGEQENPFKYLKRSTIYVSSSIFEGFPNSLLEAMVCGLPVISSDCKTGPREILEPNNIYNATNGIENCEYGILVSPLNPDENWSPTFFSSDEKKLAEAMHMLLENNTLRSYYAQKSIQRSRMFEGSVISTEYERIIG